MDKTDLKPEYLLLEDAAAYLNTTSRKIALFRKYGLLRACKFGKNYCYKRSWLDDFADAWANFDLSNESKIQLAISEKQWREKHGY